MAKKSVILTPSTMKLLKTVGEQIKLARLRRKLPVQIVAERASISRATLWQIENGEPTVSFGAYVAVLCALGLKEDVTLLAKDDILGKTYQDLDLLPKKRIQWKKDKEKEKD